ncbi:uncharacterized protein N7459_000811 [Penicillium hispanicum]|uniref:uncharacterized protein n=1 Tax=Penicillium hispanicum TaxID=1080232 RepID=UPI0025425B12|nr:uncharacterized protein N7459_000811 [Penicillium hispanicum]KAJ5594603.1 hypothetical protein N7459_000811 [Penicillium hispanicum]
MTLQHELPSHPKQKRASKPKVRTGCFTCKCIRTGRQCEGYWTPRSTTLLPKALAPAPVVDSNIEPRALEFFYLRTAPQLAGFFGDAFFLGSVLRHSLAEPAIRQAIAAIGALHERSATGKLLSRRDSPSPDVHIQLYNRSIRAVLGKIRAGQHALPLVATTNVLYACFEIFQGDVAAAVTHIQSGIKLLQSWREKNGGPVRPWGQQYQSSESHFLETEIGPLLSLFNTNVIGGDRGKRANFLMNPLDEHGTLLVTDRFETLNEARVALIDMITDVTWDLDTLDQDDSLVHRPFCDVDAFGIKNRTERNLQRWQDKVNDLVRRKQSSWNKRERQMADVINTIRLSTNFGLLSYQTECECDWDLRRADYEELVRLAEGIVSDRARFPDDLSRTLSLDFGMIFPLHAVAWKCRWPKIRRQGLDLLLRIPKREWLFEAAHYHAIFSRIMEIEEACLGLPAGEVPDENWLPPEHVRIHDFIVNKKSGPHGKALYSVSFFMKPQGLDGPLACYTEEIQLPSSQPVEAALPINMIGRRLQIDTEVSWACVHRIDVL